MHSSFREGAASRINIVHDISHPSGRFSRFTCCSLLSTWVSSFGHSGRTQIWDRKNDIKIECTLQVNYILNWQRRPTWVTIVTLKGSYMQAKVTTVLLYNNHRVEIRQMITVSTFSLWKSRYRSLTEETLASSWLSMMVWSERHALVRLSLESWGTKPRTKGFPWRSQL